MPAWADVPGRSRGGAGGQELDVGGGEWGLQAPLLPDGLFQDQRGERVGSAKVPAV